MNDIWEPYKVYYVLKHGTICLYTLFGTDGEGAEHSRAAEAVFLRSEFSVKNELACKLIHPYVMIVKDFSMALALDAYVNNIGKES